MRRFIEVEANLIDVIPQPRGTCMCSGPSTHPYGRSNRFVTKILLIHIKVISDDQMPLHLYHGYSHTGMNDLHIKITLVHSPVRLSRERVGYLSWSCLLGIVHKTRSYSQTALQTNSVGMINDKVVIVRVVRL
jgi:hypothetical protein